MIDQGRLLDYREHPTVQLIHDSSHMEQIITQPGSSTTPPEEIFGPEPEHNWCYYYQKISLAVQRGDWEAAAAYAEQASAAGFEPYNRSEWIPVFETYLALGSVDDASKLANQIRKDQNLRYLYCNQDQNAENLAAYALICENE